MNLLTNCINFNIEISLTLIMICNYVFKQKPMVNALNSGAFELQKKEMKGMVNYVMNMFNRFINSNETMRLDESFSVYFKVLSMPHVKYPYHRRKAIVGCHNSSCISRKKKGLRISKVWIKFDLI